MNLWQVLLLIVVIAAIIYGILLVVSKRMEKKQAGQREQLEANAQNVSMLIIDKKRMKLKDAGLPKIVLDQTPKYLRGSKVPIVKAKIGPKIMVLMADEAIYNQIPVKAEIKAKVSGIYITEVHNFRNAQVDAPEKKGLFARFRK